MTDPFQLSGKRILIAGASSGIGRGAAILLSQLGAYVTVSGRDEVRLQSTLSQLEGAGHLAAPFDLAQLDAIPAWIKTLAQQHGPFDGFVHSAGIHSAAPLRVIAPAALDSLMRVNFHSAVMCLKGFRQKGCNNPQGSSAVLLSSVAALAGEPGIAAYSATKAALAGLARSLAIELAPEKIRVNSLAPGFVHTEMSDRLKESLTPEQFSAIEKKHPLGVGAVQDVANAVAFLLGECARWITGATLVVDGGYTAQ